jgi:uncharacterized protein (DUF433 family)
MIMTRVATSADLGAGVYTRREAARLAKLPPGRIANWARGFAAGRPTECLPTLSFLDLLEIVFVRTFLDLGLRMRTIRHAAIEGSNLFGVAHPFCLRRFETDGPRLFAHVAETASECASLVTARGALPNTVRSIFKQIAYDPVSEMAATWWPRGRDVPVVLDPTRSFGTPIVADRGVPTHVLAGPVEAGDSPELVGNWFEVPIHDVQVAVTFERSLLVA